MDASEPNAVVVVRVYRTRTDAETAALVLEALAIRHAILPAEGGGLALVVAGVELDRALRALGAEERERAERATEQDPPAPDLGPTLAGVAVAVSIVAMFVVTGPRDAGSGWFRTGSAVAEAIRAGGLWRAVTALTLHADWSHVLGNAACAAIFVTAVCRWLGWGLGLALVLASGVLGNLATAYLTVAGHDSVGASTALFGALGLLGGMQVIRKATGVVRRGVGGSRMRRAFPIVAACLALFAMLGVSERADVIAHATGLAFGFAEGAAVARTRPLGRALQALFGVLAIALVVACWWRAGIPVRPFAGASW